MKALASAHAWLARYCPRCRATKRWRREGPSYRCAGCGARIAERNGRWTLTTERNDGPDE